MANLLIIWIGFAGFVLDTKVIYTRLSLFFLFFSEDFVESSHCNISIYQTTMDIVKAVVHHYFNIKLVFKILRFLNKSILVWVYVFSKLEFYQPKLKRIFQRWSFYAHIFELTKSDFINKLFLSDLYNIFFYIYALFNFLAF